MASILDDIQPPFTPEQRNAIALEFSDTALAAARKFWRRNHETILHNDRGITGLDDIEQMACSFMLESIPRWKPGGRNMKGYIFQSVWLLLKAEVMGRRKGLHIPTWAAVAFSRIHAQREPKKGTPEWIFQIAEKLDALEQSPFDEEIDVADGSAQVIDRMIDSEERRVFWRAASALGHESLELLYRFYGVDRPEETLAQIAVGEGIGRHGVHCRIKKAREELKRALAPIYGSTS